MPSYQLLTLPPSPRLKRLAMLEALDGRLGNLRAMVLVHSTQGVATLQCLHARGDLRAAHRFVDQGPSLRRDRESCRREGSSQLAATLQILESASTVRPRLRPRRR